MGGEDSRGNKKRREGRKRMEGWEKEREARREGIKEVGEKLDFNRRGMRGNVEGR